MALLEDRAIGALWAFRFEAGRGRLVPDRAQRECLEPSEDFVWLHFPLSDQRARLSIERLATLPEPARALLLGNERRLQLHAAGGWVYGVLPDLERDFENRVTDLGRLFIAMNAHYVITVRRHALQCVDDVRRMVETGRAVASTADLAVMLVEHFIDLNEARQHELAQEIDSIEDGVLGTRSDPSRFHVGPIRREVSRQHREFLALRSAMQRALSHRGQAHQHVLSDRLPALIQQLEDFDRDAIDLLERARLLHEEIGEQVNSMTNSNLRVLTVLTTLMMPPTLIVGAFGMNLPGIPWAQDGWGFGFAALLCVVAVGFAYLMLRLFSITR